MRVYGGVVRRLPLAKGMIRRRTPMRVQVGIIGAGPAGLLLGHVLRQAGLDVCVVERRDRAHIEGRVRAGVLERVTVDLLAQLGLDDRLRREGLVHTGIKLCGDGDMFRIDFSTLLGGAAVVVYGQQEIVRDLLDAAEPRGLPIVFGAENVALEHIDSARPRIIWRGADGMESLDCDYIAGCDGFHGVSRASVLDQLTVFERAYPFGWIGVVAEVPPCDPELIYASHADGFALASMRSPVRSRYYLQCDSGDTVAGWPDDRFWHELGLRLGVAAAEHIVRGPSLEKSIAPLRSFVTVPMRRGRIFLAGDAAHIVPPTGAKGLNLAAADVAVLAAALIGVYRDGSTEALDAYSERALGRVWKAERFSWWFTNLMHRFPGTDAFSRQMQRAEFAYLKTSRAAQTALAENYVGLPLEHFQLP
jgi:p-hydroxybenzoate 3-monooxygenase